MVITILFLHCYYYPREQEAHAASKAGQYLGPLCFLFFCTTKTINMIGSPWLLDSCDEEAGREEQSSRPLTSSDVYPQ